MNPFQSALPKDVKTRTIRMYNNIDYLQKKIWPYLDATFEVSLKRERMHQSSYHYIFDHTRQYGQTDYELFADDRGIHFTWPEDITTREMVTVSNADLDKNNIEVLISTVNRILLNRCFVVKKLEDESKS